MGLRRFLTGYDLHAEIMMLRQVDRRPILLVESEEDCGIVDPHLNEAELQSVPGFGKASVLLACTMLEVDAVHDVLGVIDLDFDDDLSSTSDYPGNVITSDMYDLDCDVVFGGGSIQSFAVNHSTRDSRRDYLTTHKIDDVQSLVTELAGALGLVRWFSVTQGIGYSLDRFPSNTLIEGFEVGNLHTSVIAMAEMRSQVVPSGKLAASELTLKRQSCFDLRRYCRGHDLIAVLAALMRRWGGTIGAKDLEDSMRAGVSCTTWRATTCCREVTAWASGLSVSPWTCT